MLSEDKPEPQTTKNGQKHVSYGGFIRMASRNLRIKIIYVRILGR